MARGFILAASALATMVFIAPNAVAWQMPLKSDFSNAQRTHLHQVQLIRASKKKIRRKMREAGYTDIRITHRGLTKTLAEGCRDGAKYRVELRFSGRIRSQDKIGHCRAPQTIAQVRQILRKQGFRKIDLIEKGDIPYIALACNKGARYRLQINLYGDVGARKQLGRCGQRIALNEIRARLRRDGYNRIEILDENQRRITLDACQAKRRYRLVLNRSGDVLDRSSVGPCSAPFSPRNIESFLASQGYNRIDVFDAEPPRYGAEACKGVDRVELGIGRSGSIFRVVKIGKCQPSISKADLRRKMVEHGFSRVRFISVDAEAYTVVACRDNKRMKILISKYGEAIDRQNIGGCSLPQLENILSQLESRGVEDMAIKIDGCRNGKRLRFTFDEFGEQIRRERIGKC